LYGYTDIVKALIEAGADINVRNNYGNTALMLSSWYGSIDIVKTLIEAGADINEHDNDGDTALILSSCNGHSDVVRVLKNARIKELKFLWPSITFDITKHIVDVY